MNPMDEKLKTLKQILSDMKSALLAFSGGVDSTFLLSVAKEVLGDKILAVTAKADIFPSYEIQEAKGIACSIGVNHIFIETGQLQNSEFIKNPTNRCYICKKILLSHLIKIAKENNLNYVLDGSNSDDLNDYRPGTKAVVELGIRSPLQEARFTKAEIRMFSQKMGLKTWNKPPLACLATRIPYGEKITKEKLRRIDQAEIFLLQLGIKGVRVRDHNNIARIEVTKEELPRLLELNCADKIVAYLKSLGYTYVTVDLEGYRTGSLNEMVEVKNGQK